MSLDLENLKNNKDEILKAEIGALLFNLGKTHIGISNWKQYFPYIDSKFSSYKDYFTKKFGNKTPFEIDLEKTDCLDNLNDFFKTKAKLFDNGGNIRDIKIEEIMKGNQSSKKIGKQTFFRGCENINSGVDKGSPKEQLDSLWSSNAFGSHKRKLELTDFDGSRICFLEKLCYFLENNSYSKKQEWGNIKNWIFKEIKKKYSRLLSDSRFPVNDVTLWDQAYMSASMFKAALSAMFLDNSKVSNYLNTPQSIKWSILGIQYDKLSLAEKGLKAASIKWYRDTSTKVDNKIKKLIEIDYALGNEVYRDETGIYFIVPENIIGDKNADFYELHKDLEELKKDIQKIFLDKFEGEVFPAIFLTEPSRGLMNLGHLIKKAKENFLKAKIPSNFDKELKDDEEPNGICNICKMRLAKKGNKENLICDVCKERQTERIKNWIDNLDKETIWLDELQDKNGRIALITLKFELGEWLNGNLVNSLLIQEKNKDLKNLLSIISKTYSNDVTKYKNFYKKSRNNQNKVEIDSFLSYFDENGIKKPFTNTYDNIIGILQKLDRNQQLRKNEKLHKDLFDRIFFDFMEKISNNDAVKNNIVDLEKKRINLDKWKREYGKPKANGLNLIRDIFAFAFVTYQIKTILLERSIGSEWKKFVCKKLNDWDESKKEAKKEKIDFEKRTIKWSKLTESNIEFLAQLVLQFLLRKNPSPARLKRVWDTTREFFEELESKIVELAEIKEERQKRLVWSNVDNLEDGEYQDGDILFWAKNKTLYLITSIEKIGDKKVFKLKKVNDKNNEPLPINIEEAEEHFYKPYFTILDPTPISWQFIIPAENVPNLIKNIKKEYYKNFKWVYGKLPLHIGVVVQNYKKPLYIGIKALRNIRMDGTKWNELRTEIDAKSLKERQETESSNKESSEKNSDLENFYSLYEKVDSKGKYEFYLYPNTNEKVWLDTTQNAIDTDRFYFYPNRFDFEFLDTNTRRNDIFYKDGKRFLRLKQQRPYDLYDWQYFERFNNYFSDEKSSSKLQKLISLIYSKLEDWKDNDNSTKLFMISAFVNILELEREEKKNEFAKVLGVSKFNEFNTMKAEEFRKKLYILLDMFDLWHTILKEV